MCSFFKIGKEMTLGSKNSWGVEGTDPKPASRLCPGERLLSGPKTPAPVLLGLYLLCFATIPIKNSVWVTNTKRPKEL